MDLTERKYFSIAKLATSQVSQSSEGILLDQQTASCKEELSLTSSFVAKSL